MKILRLLNKASLSILITFFFFQNSYSTEPVDIWKVEEKPSSNNTIDITQTDSEDTKSDLIIKTIVQENNKSEIEETKDLFSKKTNIVGIYDPGENDLTMDMWVNSNGTKVLEILGKIEKLNLSKDASEILNIALLTNSYIPTKNIEKEEFLKKKNDWLIKQEDFDLIKTYLRKNQDLENRSDLIRYYLNNYLSKSDLGKACEIFNLIKIEINDDYISQFKIYCLINAEKKEEAQLYFDLLKENGFKQDFFEKKFVHLMGYEENISEEISEKNLLDFHLSHRTINNFNFEPNLDTSKLIWKYLASSNLLEKIDLIDLEDKEKISTIEKATNDKNYTEKELFALYERFKFNINQLLTVEESYKLLTGPESRALVYQGVLISKESSEKIKLIKLLKDLFQNDNITGAFDVKLSEFLEEIDQEEVPSDYTDFYNSNKNSNKSEVTKIKFNNKIIHQSKILNYFKENSDLKNTEKDLENILKKIKKDKKYYFSTKDLIMLESLKSDKVKFPEKYKDIYELRDSNIPYDIQIMIRKKETGLALLRLVEIIGQDKIIDIGTETLYFIISVLNQLDLDRIRNKLILEVLPLKI